MSLKLFLFIKISQLVTSISTHKLAKKFEVGNEVTDLPPLQI